MSNEAWLAVALVAVGGGLGAYVWYLTARRRHLADRLERMSENDS